MKPRSQPSRGYALVTAIVFLVLLTLVALAAIRGTGLEVKSGSNSALRAEAFEASETARTQVGSLIERLCRNGGWPAAIGGQVPNAEFTAALPAGITINNRDGANGPDNWCIEPDSELVFDPRTMDTDAVYSRDLRSTLGVQINGEVAVRRLYTSTGSGAGQAQAAGYSSAGIGVAGGGGQTFFYVRSRGTERGDGAEASTDTAAVYRYVIRR
ncbi:PilX N-terminal domain-containing pilus assembly protein [Nevskia ramosa]|uniref:PilX N-terminal domain-containing pilus assembly protein n=1 Tax=Nevskia ramosa TaxID=64002 RepID=UPI0003B2E4C6|nr:PilX N-terminal domain-containing pilus assembly protein [Nevskia ramosa]